MAEPTTVLGTGLLTKYVLDVSQGLLKSGGQEGVKLLYKHVKDRLKDDEIPATHDLNKAVVEALLEAARAFALGVAVELGDKPALVDVAKKHLAERTFPKKPLLQLRKVEGEDWVKELLGEAKPGAGGKGGIAADFIMSENKLTTLLADAKGSGGVLEKRVVDAFSKWLDRHVQQADRPACVGEFLKKGWPLEKGGKKRVSFYEAFVLFLREKIKTVAVVRDIFLAQTASGIAEDVKSLLAKAALKEETFQPWLEGQLGGLKDWLEPRLDRLQATGDESNTRLAKVETALAELPAAILRGNPLVLYRENLRRRFSPHKVIGLGANEPPGQNPARDDITDLFVPPTFTQERLSPEGMEEAMRKGDKEASALLLPRLEQERRLVLLADPGMGKSTLIHWLVVALAAEGAPPVEAVRFGEAVPFPIVLRDVMPHLQRLHPKVEDWTWQRLLTVFLEHYQPDGFQEPLARPLKERGFDLKQVLESANAWFFIDGLDEVGSVTQREALRRVLWEGFDAHPQARWLITSRVVGYAEVAVHLRRPVLPEGASPHAKSFREFREELDTTLFNRTPPKTTLLHLAPWNNEQQSAFARHWFTRRLDSTEGPPFGERFIEDVRTNSGTAVIGRVPNVLLLMALLYRYRAYLPHGRAKVYEGISEAYLEQIAATAHIGHRKTVMDLREKERLLAIVAMHLQAKREEIINQEAQETADQKGPKKKLKKSGQGGEILASEEELQSWLFSEFGDVKEMKTFINHIADSSGILLPRGQGSYAFAHLSFQEYYAACWLEHEFRRLLNEKQTGRRAGRFGGGASSPPAAHPVLGMTEARFQQCAEAVIWHEPLLFLAEKLANGNDVQTLMEWMFDWREDASPPLPFQAAQLLATFSVDKQVEITPSGREVIWDMLWGAWTGLQPTKPWPVDPILLGSHPFSDMVLERLKSCLGTATHLAFTRCAALKDLTVLKKAASLQSLEVEYCPNIEDFSQLVDARELEHLGITWSPHLTIFPSIKPPSKLKTLSLAACPALTNIDSITNASSLKELTIFSCPNIKDLGALSKLTSLKGLGLHSCDSSLNEVTLTSNLASLMLNDFPNLQQLPNLIRQGRLESLNLLSCPKLQNLNGLSHTSQLNFLQLNRCDSLTDISGLKSLDAAIIIFLTDLPALEDISALSNALELISLHMTKINVPDLSAIMRLTSLRDLCLTDCPKITQDAVDAFKKAQPQCKVTWHKSPAAD